MRNRIRSRRRRKRVAQIAQTGPLVVTAAAAVAAAAAFLRRRRGASPEIGGDPDFGNKPIHGGDGDAVEQWACECGQEYRVSGTGRHRVFWPEGADPSEPVLGDTCTNCDRPLPVKGVETAAG